MSRKDSVYVPTQENDIASANSVINGNQNTFKEDLLLNYSFSELTEFPDVQTAEPRQFESITCMTNSKDNWKHSNYVLRALRLSNNKISAVPKPTTAFLNISWLDVSFNSFTGINGTICELKNLSILYFHGNLIEKLSEVEKLSSLENLHIFTMHGNPVEANKSYRSFIIAKLPKLKSLDFSAISKQERREARNSNFDFDSTVQKLIQSANVKSVLEELRVSVEKIDQEIRTKVSSDHVEILSALIQEDFVSKLDPKVESVENILGKAASSLSNFDKQFQSQKILLERISALIVGLKALNN